MLGRLYGAAKKLGGGLKFLFGIMKKNPIILIIALVALLIRWFLNLWRNNEEFREFFINLWEGIKDFFAGIGEAIGKIIEWLGDRFGFVVDSILAAAYNIKKILSGIIDFIVGVFTGDWERAWQGVQDIFSGIVGGLWAIFKIPLNLIISGINTFIRG
ncbi:MAG: hypothetical protein FWC95_02315, partial [Defluviitaleaceae bacterium]|nr:hypothetical protein [Defluviitaleaceae bacterium]